jgi:putative ABC transport system ATP-binding protein
VTESSLISTTGLVHRFGGQTVLNLPDWSVGAGQHWLVLGPSGSGKTTLLNALLGLLMPSEGQVLLNGHSTVSMSAAKLDTLRGQMFGVVFQTLRLIGSISVRQNLELAQSLSGRGVEAAWIDHLAGRLGIAALLNRKPRELSVGEAQRAAIARALAPKPPVVIADEPTSALDDANAEAVADLLMELASAQNSALIVATHDARLKSRFSQTLTLAKVGAPA